MLLNRLIWLLPGPVHTLICYLTGWRLIHDEDGRLFWAYWPYERRRP